MSTLAYCAVSISPVRINAEDSSEMVTQLLFGEVVDILEETDKWLKIKTYFDDYIGWIDPKQLIRISKKEVGRWLDGLSYQNEIVATLQTSHGKQRIFKGSFVPCIIEDAFKIGNEEYIVLDKITSNSTSTVVDIALDYLNAPYLWGGKTPFGIDCSGLTQMCFRFLGINLPRDASQQVDHGTSIDFSERLAGDVLFFHNDAGKIIHVGIIIDEITIIHASGQVRIDNYDEKGIIHHPGEYYTHHFDAIKRML